MKRFRKGAGLTALILLGITFVLIAIVPLLPSSDAYTQNLGDGLLPAGGRSFDEQLYLLGTDTLGRDLLSRLALAGQVSFMIAIVAVAMSLVIGAVLGLVGGFFGGWTESVIMGIADLQLSIPRILLLIAVSAVVGPSVVLLAVMLGLTSWVSYGRVARAMVLSLKRREFVLSATTQGAGAGWNMRKHLLPNVLPQLLVVASHEFGQVIVLEASLSYLGLGVQPPLPSWGMMVAEGQSYLALAPMLSVLPSIALFCLVAGTQFLSQAFTSESDVVGDMSRAKP
ncbi:ABC transporter permease [Roseomonas haemaphysalidis]|uniref:ABC transporter permease n=1 Tax=Roseomonas haemaphysalidis TaxID=2768162 RepID=A0ABS3KVQ6_9PROT|nr:ABC transporter permease [Roseomonas haemaphysalidis]MBO1080703.1 ABC transporter permease [Roseomonas haemaphysalidis]